MNPRYVNVPVPEHLVEEVMKLIVEAESPVSTANRPPHFEGKTPRVTADLLGETYPEYAQMEDEDVRDAYRASSRLQNGCGKSSPHIRTSASSLEC